MSKGCEEIQESLSAHLDGELAGDELRDLQAHLSTCQNCQRIVKDYTRIGQLLREQIAQEAAGIDLGTLPEKVIKGIQASTHLRPGPWEVTGMRKRRWQVPSLGGWALGLAMAIALVWLGPQLWRAPGKTGQPALGGAIQEQLGQAIRDAAGVRSAVLQVSASYQEQLGQLIRQRSRTGIQEQLGLLIRDHSHSQWDLHQQFGQLQERIGFLIQTHARLQST
jgi:predicted anti-sigma-YlaC factor YlaD